MSILCAAGSVDAALLRDAPPAHWIRTAAEPELAARRTFTSRTQFRLELPAHSLDGSLELLVLGHVRVLLDEQPIFEQFLTGEARQQRALVSLPRSDRAQILRIDVANPHGPAAMRARCEALRLYSSNEWMSRPQIEGRDFAPSAQLLAFRSPELARQFPSTGRALSHSAPLFAALFALAWIAFRWASKRPNSWAWFRPERFRFLLMALWVLLSIRNLPRLPDELGFDAPFHLEYVGFIYRTGHLPLASDGWQMFQSPLYYLLAAVFYRLLDLGLESAAALRGLRAISLLCGLVQIELVFRTLRHFHPDRPALWSAGTAFGAFLPINLYMSQWVGNEPLAGVFAAAALLLCCFPGRKGSAMTVPQRLALGALLGLAVLSKVSALLLVPLVLLYLWRARAQSVPALLQTVLVFGLLCGWIFVRNWLELGHPLLLSSQDVDWWQAPGFRSWRHLYGFGVSLSRPVMAGLHSFGDSFYSTLWLDGQLSSAIDFAARPPWRYDAMLACAPLALLPSFLLLIGMLYALRRGDARLRLFAAALAVYGLALLQQYFALPIYSTGKASYTLGLLPVYAVLVLQGLQAIAAERRWLRDLLLAYLCAFAGQAYVGYFAL